MMLQDDIPGWLQTLITLALGAGGLGIVRVWLENRRLGKKDFRDTLISRIGDLEAIVARMQVRMGTLRVEMAHLEVENANLKRQLGGDDADAERNEGG